MAKSLTHRLAAPINTQCNFGENPKSSANELTDRHGQPRHIVHRDISPQNILVTKDGWVKIIDFGIAKAASRLTQTRPGMIKGKFAYMAPEQLKGESDHRADLFAMGVTLWETLAGVRLFHSTTDVDTLQKVLHMAPPPIHLTHPDTPKELDAILAKALNKLPEKRYQTAREFKNELLGFMAPMTKEEMRSTVDIEASALGDRVIADLPSGAVTDDVTPVADFGIVRKARRKSRRWLWISLRFYSSPGAERPPGSGYPGRVRRRKARPTPARWRWMQAWPLRKRETRGWTARKRLPYRGTGRRKSRPSLRMSKRR